MSDKGFIGADAVSRSMEAFRSSAEEFARLFGQMRLPGMPDSQTLIDAHKRNMEALTRAHQVAMDGIQTVARRNAELMQQAMSELAETMRSLTSTAGEPQQRMTHQAELLRRAYDRSVEHTRALGELVQKTNQDAIDLLNRRFVEGMDEVKGLIAQAKATKD